MAKLHKYILAPVLALLLLLSILFVGCSNGGNNLSSLDNAIKDLEIFQEIVNYVKDNGTKNTDGNYTFTFTNTNSTATYATTYNANIDILSISGNYSSYPNNQLFKIKIDVPHLKSLEYPKTTFKANGYLPNSYACSFTIPANTANNSTVLPVGVREIQHLDNYTCPDISLDGYLSNVATTVEHTLREFNFYFRDKTSLKNTNDSFATLYYYFNLPQRIRFKESQEPYNAFQELSSYIMDTGTKQNDSYSLKYSYKEDSYQSTTIKEEDYTTFSYDKNIDKITIQHTSAWATITYSLPRLNNYSNATYPVNIAFKRVAPESAPFSATATLTLKARPFTDIYDTISIPDFDSITSNLTSSQKWEVKTCTQSALIFSLSSLESLYHYKVRYGASKAYCYTFEYFYLPYIH